MRGDDGLTRDQKPYAGFCVGGYNWPAPELTGAYDAAHERAIRRRIAAEDARLTRSLGGNLLRIFWSAESLFSGDPEDLSVALNALARGDLHNRSVFMYELADRVERLDRCHVVLDQLLASLDAERDSPITLQLDALDAVVAGLHDANRGLATLYGSCSRWLALLQDGSSKPLRMRR